MKIPLLLLGLLGVWSVQAQSSRSKITVDTDAQGLCQALVFIPGDSLLYHSPNAKNDGTSVLSVAGDSFWQGGLEYQWFAREGYQEVSFALPDAEQMNTMMVRLDRSIISNALFTSNCEFKDTLGGLADGFNLQVVNNGGNEHVFGRFFCETHSMTRVQGVDRRLSRVRIFFKGIEPQDLPVFHVLTKIMGQRDATFSKNMIASGLNTEAMLYFNPMSCGKYLFFELTPNPFGIRAAIEAFFVQLNRMPQFDYTTKEQLQLAKEQLRIDQEFANDRFSTRAIQYASFWANGAAEMMPTYMDSANGVTKVDIMNFIRKYMQRSPFLIMAEVPQDEKDEVLEYMPQTKRIEAYVVRYDDERASRLQKAQVIELQGVTYLLSLTSWAEVSVHVYGKKKKTRARRIKALKGYFGAQDIENKLVFIEHKSNKSTTDQGPSEYVTFSIAADD